ncbi:MAG: hypothetical protein LUQ65_04570 [Candidatus Helarchaeota archaeon]|nr:hypothetical protein [Candidatus Helarchaeota archaeon]
MSELKKCPKCGKTIDTKTKDSIKAMKGPVYCPYCKKELPVFRIMQ